MGRLHNEELHNLYASRNVTRVMKSKEKKMRSYGSHGTDEKCIQNFDRKTGRDHLEDLNVDESVMME